MLSSFPPVHESVPSPTVSASRKKQKTGQSVSALSGGGALSSANGMHPSLQPSSSNLKRGPLPGSRGKKAKAVSLWRYQNLKITWVFNYFAVCIMFWRSCLIFLDKLHLISASKCLCFDQS